MKNPSRRSFLKGLSLGTGTVVLQPFLNSLRAQDAGTIPQRIIFFMEGNGLWPSHIQPKGLKWKGDDRQSKADRLLDLSLEDYEVNDALAALAPFKDRMTILQGLSGLVSGGGDHSKGYGGLGCFHWRKGVFAQTLDHVLAESLPGIIPVVGLGIHPDPQTPIINSVSAIGPKKPLPLVCQPELAFQTLFGSVAEGNAGKVFQARNKLLDYVRSDIRRVRKELSGSDTEKLDAYLETFDRMRNRQARCLEIKERLKANAPVIDKFNSESETDRLEAQCDIAAAVITSGLSNVVTLDASGGMGTYFTWKGLGINKEGHAIGHMHPDQAETQRLRSIIRNFHAERIAGLAKKLDSVKEGNGTVLDNTLIVYMSDSGEAHHGFLKAWPTVLIGKMKGLKLGGRFLQYPEYGKNGHRTMRNLFLALLHAVGDKRENFGAEDRELKDLDQSGPLAEILG